MFQILSMLALALAVSIDGFGVGVTYGLRKIQIPLKSIVIIVLCSALVIFLTMNIGHWLTRFVNPDVAGWIGALILIAIGCWAIYNMFRNHRVASEEVEPLKEFVFEIKTLGLVIHILRKPTVADVDRSGTISSAEATLLGLALSMDAFGAGIAAGFMGMSVWITPLVIGAMNLLFILMGYRIGFKFADNKWMKRLSVIPGLILILFGIIKIL